MLKGIDPLLNGTLLRHLQEMGHGDVLALVDRNFPASSSATRWVELSGSTIDEAATAIFSVFPVDTFVETPAFRMGPVGDESNELDVHRSFRTAIDAAEGRAVDIGPVERFEFYRRAADAYLTVSTGETRPYGCFLVVKGVV